MKLLLLFLVLIGVVLIDVSQARTVEKRNAGDAMLLKMFKADTSECKCVNRYCLKKKPYQNEYTKVNGCGERKCYTQCDYGGCREVCDGQCKCPGLDRCAKCDDKGCEKVNYCDGDFFADRTEKCQECTDNGCKEVRCNRLCKDSTGDNLIQDEICACKKDGDGKLKCDLCTKLGCKTVETCDTYATCTCTKNSREDSYRRCYGHKDGETQCRTMYSCSEYEKRKEEWDTNYKKAGEDGWKVGDKRNFAQEYFASCECPSNGGTCKMCDEYGTCRYWKEYKYYPGDYGFYTCSKWLNDLNKHVYNVTAHLH